MEIIQNHIECNVIIIAKSLKDFKPQKVKINFKQKNHFKMKKVVSIIIAMSFLFTSYSQKVNNLPDTAKLTLNKVYEDVNIGISGLAQSLKVPATHVYGILVRQQFTYSIVNILTVFGLFIFCFLSGRYAKLTYKEHLALYKSIKGSGDASIDDTPKGPLAVFLTIISVLLGIAGVVFLCFKMQQTAIGITNPEYGAIKEIISFVK